MEVAFAVAEQHDRVRHDLAGAVVGDVTAALDADHLDVAGHEHVGLGFAPPAEREHVGMLDEQQRVAAVVARALPVLDQRELPGPGVAEALGAEVDDHPVAHRSSATTDRA